MTAILRHGLLKNLVNDKNKVDYQITPRGYAIASKNIQLKWQLEENAKYTKIMCLLEETSFTLIQDFII